MREVGKKLGRGLWPGRGLERLVRDGGDEMR